MIDQDEIREEFQLNIQKLFQQFYVENEHNFNAQLVIDTLGYCMEALYYGADDENRHRVSSIILALMKPALDQAVHNRKLTENLE